jgi:ABC-2 type transport system permease protein
MLSMKALIKREFLEHRGAFLYAPAILLSIIAIAVAFIVVAGGGELIKLDGEIIIDGEHIIVPSGETIYQIGLAVTFLVWFVYLSVALFFYYADSFSADRRNNALLFWKSIPQSDLKILTSKVLSGITIFASLIFGFALLTGILMYLVLVVISLLHSDIAAPGLFFAAKTLVKMGLVGAIFYILLLLTQAPALAWVAGLSTLFRRWSIPLAFLIPGTIILLEFINSIIGFGNGRPFAEFLGNWFEFDILDGDFATEIFSEPTKDVPFELLKLILSQTDWLGMGVGLAVTAGVVYLASEYRRRRIGA